MEGVKFDLTGKVAIVTGGGKGIGRAIALELAASGAAVTIAARNQQEIEAVAEEINQRGGKSIAVVTDLTSNEQLETMVQKTLNTFGRIDILVNNAARSFLRSLLEMREDGWDKVFDTNVKAAWLLSRLVARTMVEQKSGQIINITTVGAEKAEAGMGAYCCSKAALKMLTRCMALEWAASGIRVNAVGPTLTRTEFSKPLWSNPELAPLVTAKIPMGRLAEPEDIVGAVLFLASGAANFITGQSIYVDGGTLTV
ncbi:MAG: 3-oxoacyl-ACP reductase FabG [Syntrophales bacterium]|jgi:NAD(P)-dependent dehydrogenase (short-subunit alcohol dehydrogenase family)|nr:3-oxoacyl-ACP reductase FabG [Syntrophales bacterium]